MHFTSLTVFSSTVRDVLGGKVHTFLVERAQEALMAQGLCGAMSALAQALALTQALAVHVTPLNAIHTECNTHGVGQKSTAEANHALCMVTIIRISGLGVEGKLPDHFIP